jgi:hypothetical protein
MFYAVVDRVVRVRAVRYQTCVHLLYRLNLARTHLPPSCRPYVTNCPGNLPVAADLVAARPWGGDRRTRVRAALRPTVHAPGVSVVQTLTYRGIRVRIERL